MKITTNERGLLEAIRDSEDGEKATPIGQLVWVNCLWGWEGTRKFPGVMASLQKKGLAVTDGEAVRLTYEGFRAVGPRDEAQRSAMLAYAADLRKRASALAEESGKQRVAGNADVADKLYNESFGLVAAATETEMVLR